MTHWSQFIRIKQTVQCSMFTVHWKYMTHNYQWQIRGQCSNDICPSQVQFSFLYCFGRNLDKVLSWRDHISGWCPNLLLISSFLNLPLVNCMAPTNQFSKSQNDCKQESPPAWPPAIQPVWGVLTCPVRGGGGGPTDRITDRTRR